ncbi:MAG: hypothetical protein EKK48_25690 [Candidatus Melainabacteria bacterium]|nr:MAG: hypothetical protein EKK48_25690 [Candidatus Melainabacteria bacterium]
MRSFKLLLCTAMAYVASTVGANAQNANGLIVAPFAVGNPALFASAILNVNLPSFFNGSNVYAGGINLGSGTAPTADTAGERPSVFSRARNLAYQYSSNTVNYTTTEPVLVFTDLAASSDPRTGSCGVSISNLASPSNVSSVTFQYSPMSLQTGLVTSNFASAPYLVIVDGVNGNRVRYLPITAGSVVSNYALNRFNGLNQPGATAAQPTDNTPVLSNAFISVSFNAAQLGIQGTVQKIGLVVFNPSLTLVKNIGVNNQPTTGVIAGSSNVYPF